MKNLARNLTFAVAIMALNSVSFAQGAGPQGGAPGVGQQGGRRGGGQGMGGMRRMGGARMAQRNKELFAKLNLTADQKKKIEALQKKHQEKMRATFTQAGGPSADRQALMEKFREMQKGYRAELMKILTPAQEKQYSAAVKEMREKMRKERGQGGPGGAPGRRPGQGGGL